MADAQKPVTESPAENEPSLASRSIAIAGFVVIVIIVIWGLVHIASLLSPWFSGTSSSTLTVQAPANATSGQSFTVRWTNTSGAKGTYAFTFPCDSSLAMQTPSAQGALISLPCGAAYAVTGTSLSLTPALTGSTTLSVPFTVTFTPTSGSRVQASANVVIHPAAVVTPTPKPVSAPSKPSTPTVGPADLSVTLVSATIDQYGNGTVVFDIGNAGPDASGGYTFQAFLPMQGQTYTYSSPVQVSLSAGSHIVSTLRFTTAIAGAVSVIVDPSNSVQDGNRANNYAGQTISAPYGYTPQYNYYTNPAPYVY